LTTMSVMSYGRFIQLELPQNRELRDRIRDLERFEKESEQLEALDAQLHEIRLENELLRRRLEDLGSDSESRTDLLQKLEETTRRAEEAEALQNKVDALEARLFALDAPPVDEAEPRRKTEGHHQALLEDGPGTLIRAGAKTSVLADNAGLPIAAAGIPEHHESLAALSGLALEFAGRVTSLLPLTNIRTVQLVGQQHMAVYWALFESHGDQYALCAVGDTIPDAPSLHDAVQQAQGAIDHAGGFA